MNRVLWAPCLLSSLAIASAARSKGEQHRSAFIRERPKLVVNRRASRRTAVYIRGGWLPPLRPERRVPSTILEEIEQMQNHGRRVRLSRSQLPGLPRMGWHERGFGKEYEKIDCGYPIRVKEYIPGFTAKVDNWNDIYPYSSQWTCSANPAVDLYWETALHFFIAYPGRNFNARALRPVRVPARSKSRDTARLKRIERYQLHGFFVGCTDYKRVHDLIWGIPVYRTWARYVRRVECTTRCPISAYFSLGYKGGCLPLLSFASSIRTVWVEFTVRVDQKGRPIRHPPLYGRIIGFATPTDLYLIEQRPVQAQSEVGYYQGDSPDMPAARIDQSDY